MFTQTFKRIFQRTFKWMATKGDEPLNRACATYKTTDFSTYSTLTAVYCHKGSNSLQKHNSLKMLLSVTLVPCKLHQRDIYKTCRSLKVWVFDILELMVHSWCCSELRVIKHLQGCFIPQRTTTRSTHAHFTFVTL